MVFNNISNLNPFAPIEPPTQLNTSLQHVWPHIPVSPASFTEPPPTFPVPPPTFPVPPLDFTVLPPLFTGPPSLFKAQSYAATVPLLDFTLPPPDLSSSALVSVPDLTLPLPDLTLPPPFLRLPISHTSLSSSSKRPSSSPKLILDSNTLSQESRVSSESIFENNHRNKTDLSKSNSQLTVRHAEGRHDKKRRFAFSLQESHCQYAQHRSCTQRAINNVHRRDSFGKCIDRSTSRHTNSNTHNRSRSVNSQDNFSSRVQSPSCREYSSVENVARRIDQYSKNHTNEGDKNRNICVSQPTWYRSSPDKVYYTRCGGDLVHGTPQLENLCATFRDTLLTRPTSTTSTTFPHPPSTGEQSPPQRDTEPLQQDDSDESQSEEEGRAAEEALLRRVAERAAAELRRKQRHPRRLHPDLWYNDEGELNSGAECRCSRSARRAGIHHGVFPGEPRYPPCRPHANNLDTLHHYRITISPPTNFLTKDPTVIVHDGNEFVFCGFSIFSHCELKNIPPCKFVRYKIEYTIYLEEEPAPTNFTIQELRLFQDYLFVEILELVDFARLGDTSCRYHFMPRFIRSVECGGCEMLSMSEVLGYLIASSEPLIVQDDGKLRQMDDSSWEHFLDKVKGSIVRNPEKKPTSLRLDYVDRPASGACADASTAPQIVHFGWRPAQLCHLGDVQYQKAWRQWAKYRSAVAKMPEPTAQSKRRLREAEARLGALRRRGGCGPRRDVTITLSSDGFRMTGIRTDVVQHAMLIPVLVMDLRFHASLASLEARLHYRFRRRSLLATALAHASHAARYGTNADHARNALANCGPRRPSRGRAHTHLPHAGARKRGFKKQNLSMADTGSASECVSTASHNERLEYLGDAVLCFLTSLHLYTMFPEHGEGVLSTYRTALVQNNHLAVLAQGLELHKYMLVSHGPDLCQAAVMRHAMADCFEALVGAVYLDGGIEAADAVVAAVLWREGGARAAWSRSRPHPLCAQEPLGDRAYVDRYRTLRRLTRLEETTGIRFHHIRLLAQALTTQSVGYNHLTMGSNQCLEFLGDALLQLRVSDHLYRHFPDHQEGHLTLLRTCLVNNRTLASVSDELDLGAYVVSSDPTFRPSIAKQKADLFEAFVAAVYLDKGMDYVDGVLKVCLLSKLPDLIAGGKWNDPKTLLQQICISLRSLGSPKPELPRYRVVGVQGPTDTRQFTVVVYFGGQRLATATGRTKMSAEMAAAQAAIDMWNNHEPRILRILKPQSEEGHHETSEFVWRQNCHRINKRHSSSRTSSDSTDESECRNISIDEDLSSQFNIVQVTINK